MTSRTDQAAFEDTDGPANPVVVNVEPAEGTDGLWHVTFDGVADADAVPFSDARRRAVTTVFNAPGRYEMGETLAH